MLTSLVESKHDVLLLDINMPGRSGMEVLKDVKHIYPHLPVIMVSVQPESQYAARCLLAGARDYVSKNSASEDLAPAIQRMLDDGALCKWNIELTIVIDSEESSHAIRANPSPIRTARRYPNDGS